MDTDEQPKLQSRGLHGARPGRGRRGLGESCVDGALWAGTAGNVFVSHANECSPKSNFCEEALSDPADQTTSRVDGSSALPGPSRSHPAGSGGMGARTGAAPRPVHQSQSPAVAAEGPLLSAGFCREPRASWKSQRFVFSGGESSRDVKLPFLSTARQPQAFVPIRCLIRHHVICTPLLQASPGRANSSRRTATGSYSCAQLCGQAS